MSHPLHRLRELLQQQAAAIEELDTDRISALDAELHEAVAGLPSRATTAAEHALALRAGNELRLSERLVDVGSRITRIGYGRAALRAYSPSGAAFQAFRSVDQGA
jgi:hypothetical protein